MQMQEYARVFKSVQSARHVHTLADSGHTVEVSSPADKVVIVRVVGWYRRRDVLSQRQVQRGQEVGHAVCHALRQRIGLCGTTGSSKLFLQHLGQVYTDTIIPVLLATGGGRVVGVCTCVHEVLHAGSPLRCHAAFSTSWRLVQGRW